MAKRRPVTKADVDRVLATLEAKPSAKQLEKRAKFNADYVAELDKFNADRKIRTDERRKTLFSSTGGKLPKDEQTREYLAQMQGADADSRDLGTPRQEKKSWFNRTIDVLSRGNYASAEAWKEGFDPKTKAFWEPWEAIKGFGSGLAGKEKTTFKDVLKEHGHTGKGMGTLGFALDVAADPLTYTGLGVVGKVAGGSKKAKQALEEVAKLENDLVRKGASRDQVRAALNADALPAQLINKKHRKQLTTEARALYDNVIDVRGGDNSKAVDKIITGFKRSLPNAAHVDVRWLEDTDFRDIVVNTIRAEEKAYPALTHSLRNVRATNIPSGANADSRAAFADIMARKRTGQMRIDKTRTGKRNNLTEQHANEIKYAPDFSSVKTADSNEFIKYITTHEVGHQIAQHMDEAAKAALVAKVTSKFGTDWSKQLSEYANNTSYPHEGTNFKRFEELTAEAWAEFRMLGDNARPLAKLVADEMIKAAPKVPSKSETSNILRELADDAIEADVKNIDEWAEEQIVKKYGELRGEHIPEFEALANSRRAERGIADVKAAKKALQEQLLSVAARNLDSKVKKEFAIKIGPTALGIPKSGDAAAKAGQAIASIPGIKQSIDKFNDLFRANAHIPKGLQHLRSKHQGNSMFLVTQHIKVLQSIFGPTSKAQRHAVLKAYRDGAFEGSTVGGGMDLNGQPVENLVQYIKDEIDSLDISVGNNSLTMEEINAFLGKNFKVMPTAKTGIKKVRAVDESGRPYLKEVKTVTKELSSNPISEAILGNTNIKDPAQALFLYSAAVNQAIAKRNMWTTVANTHGVPKSELGEKLAKEHGWVESTVNPNAKGFYFPPEVAEGMAKIEEVFKNERTTGQLVDQYDRALQGFKSVVTRYNPSFHSRTFLGEMLLGYMGGMKSIPRSYSKAGMVIKGRNQHFLGEPEGAEAFGEGAGKKLIQASNVLRGAAPGNAGVVDGSKTIIRHKAFGDLSADRLWHLYMETGLKSGYAATDLVRGVEASKLTKSRDVMQSVTESVEDYGRLAHFIDAIQHSKAKTLDEAVEEAAMVTRKFHLDYTNVTGFERNVMTRVAPFYKWMRLSTPVMAEILLTRPGKAIALPKAMREISAMAGYDSENFGPFPGGADAVVPEWLRDHGAVPIGEWGGNTNYFDPTAIFPLAGSVETGETAGLKMLSPFFKLGADIYHGKDKFGNQLTGENATMSERKNYALAQTPQSNFANQMITQRDPGIPRLQTLLQFLANPGIQPNTEKRMRGEAFRQRQEAYSHRKGLRKEQGIIP